MLCDPLEGWGGTGDWEGGSKGREFMYGCFMLLHSRNSNIVKQLYFNKIKERC